MSLHFHDDIFNLCQQTEKTQTRLVESIPAEMVHKLTNDFGLKFTDTDQFEDGTYVPLHHVSPKDFVAYANSLETRAT